MIDNVIELKSSYVWLEDGIVRALAKKNTNHDLEVAEETINTVIKLSNGAKMPLLLDISTVKSSSEESRKFFQSEKANSCIKSLALILNSPSSRIIGTLFLNLNLPNYPFQIFTSEKKAIEWLSNENTE